MDAKISPISADWVPLGVNLKKAAQRKPGDRGKRSVAEMTAPESGGRLQAVQRDGFYRPEDGKAEYLTFWTATSRGWAQISAFSWNSQTSSWEAVDRPGPKPT